MMKITNRSIKTFSYKANALIFTILCVYIININQVYAEPKKLNVGKLKKPLHLSVMPDNVKLNLMIRTTLLAFSQANQTGNYSVLRDLSHPKFQLLNSNAQLADVFQNFRKRNLDLAPIIFYTPKLVRPAQIQKDGLLRMTGYFETKPERVSFDLGFWLQGKDWRLAALIVDVKPPQNQLLQVVPKAEKKKNIRGRKTNKKIIIPKKKHQN